MENYIVTATCSTANSLVAQHRPQVDWIALDCQKGLSLFPALPRVASAAECSFSKVGQSFLHRFRVRA